MGTIYGHSSGHPLNSDYPLKGHIFLTEEAAQNRKRDLATKRNKLTNRLFGLTDRWAIFFGALFVLIMLNASSVFGLNQFFSSLLSLVGLMSCLAFVALARTFNYTPREKSDHLKYQIDQLDDEEVSPDMLGDLRETFPIFDRHLKQNGSPSFFCKSDWLVVEEAIVWERELMERQELIAFLGNNRTTAPPDNQTNPLICLILPQTCRAPSAFRSPKDFCHEI